jgi:LCP family protein required for cell wall assembly
VFPSPPGARELGLVREMDRASNLVFQIGPDPTELVQEPADLAGRVRELVGSENDHRDQGDDRELTAAHVEHHPSVQPSALHSPPAAADVGLPAVRPAPPNVAQMSRRGDRRTSHRRSWRQRVVLAIGVVTATACLIAAGGVAFVSYKLSQVRRVDVALSAPLAPGAPENFLIAGSDTRAKVSPTDPNAKAFLSGPSSTGPGLSDSIMIVRVDPQNQSVTMLSLPRDLWVPIAGTRTAAKINSAFSLGPQTLVDTIQSDFGIAINHYIEVDFAGFQHLVDAIGGISAYFDVPMRDLNSGVDVQHPGCVKLDGSAALALARSRHLEYKNPNGHWVSDGANDFGRIQRQQFLIKKAIEKLKAQNLLTNPGELNDLTDAVTSSVGFDRTLDVTHLISLARQLQNLNPDGLVSLTAPVTRYNPAPDGSDAQKLIADQAAPMFAQFGAPPAATTATTSPAAALAAAPRNRQAPTRLDRPDRPRHLTEM